MKVRLWKGAKSGAVSMLLPIMILAEVHASNEDVHKIIEVCTLSEKIMKDYALTGMGITYHNPQKELAKLIARLDHDMEELKKHKLSEKLQKEEEALHREWAKIEGNLTKAPSKENALSLYRYVSKFAEHCETLAEHLAADTGNPAEHYVVLIERLNLDVQAMSAVYTMKAWGAMAEEEYSPEAKQLIEDYQKTLDELQKADEKMVSKSVKSDLQSMNKHFVFFEHMLESTSGRFVPLLLAKKAEKLEDEIEKILKKEELEVEK